MLPVYATDSNMWWMALHLVLLLCCPVFHCFLSTCTSCNHVFSLTLSDESKLTVYADDILLYKSISHSGDYSGLQTYIDTIQDYISANKSVNTLRTRHPHLPWTGFLLGPWCYIRAGWKLSLSRSIGDIEVNLVRSHWTKTRKLVRKYTHICF